MKKAIICGSSFRSSQGKRGITKYDVRNAPRYCLLEERWSPVLRNVWQPLVVSLSDYALKAAHESGGRKMRSSRSHSATSLRSRSLCAAIKGFCFRPLHPRGHAVEQQDWLCLRISEVPLGTHPCKNQQESSHGCRVVNDRDALMQGFLRSIDCVQMMTLVDHAGNVVSRSDRRGCDLKEVVAC